MGYGNAVAGNAYWGVETIKLQAAAARVAGDVVRISTGLTNGALADLSIADDTNVYRVAVALENAAIGDVYEAAYKGTVTVTVPSATYTVGHGLTINNGGVEDSSAAAENFSGVTTVNDFGLIVVGGTTVTSVTCTLYGDPFTATT